MHVYVRAPVCVCVCVSLRVSGSPIPSRWAPARFSLPLPPIFLVNTNLVSVNQASWTAFCSACGCNAAPAISARDFWWNGHYTWVHKFIVCPLPAITGNKITTLIGSCLTSTSYGEGQRGQRVKEKCIRWGWYTSLNLLYIFVTRSARGHDVDLCFVMVFLFFKNQKVRGAAGGSRPAVYGRCPPCPAAET